MATYEQWLDAFKQSYSGPDRISELPCPNCGVRKLELRFVIYSDQRNAANAVFWCGNCLEGMTPGPSQVPAICTPIRAEDANVPNYRIVPPTGRGEHASRL
jgi:hypothetical protein